MADSSRIPAALDDALPYVAAILTYIVAAIHLFHPDRGLPRLALLTATDNLGLLAADPRPILFVVFGGLLLLGPQILLTVDRRRLLYAAGMAITAGFVAGYFLWHLTGHGGFIPGAGGTPHELAPIQSVFQHLAEDQVAAFSKLVEAALFAILLVFYRRETAANRDASEVRTPAAAEDV